MPPAWAKSAESAVQWLVEQARSRAFSQNVHMQSVVAFFKKEIPHNDVNGIVFDAACSDDADVSKQGKEVFAG